jgi:hypothetical protein
MVVVDADKLRTTMASAQESSFENRTAIFSGSPCLVGQTFLSVGAGKAFIVSNGRDFPFLIFHLNPAADQVNYACRQQ